MDEREYLVLLLLAFYLVEGACWVRAGTVLFVQNVLLRRRRVTSAKFLENDNGGIVHLGLLPGIYGIEVETWPVSLSPLGIYSGVLDSLADQSRERRQVFVAWEKVRTVAADDRRVLVNGNFFCDTASPSRASFVCECLNELAATPEIFRCEKIRMQLRRLTSIDLARQSASVVWRAIRPPVLISIALWVIGFVCGPLLLWIIPVSTASHRWGWTLASAFVVLWGVGVLAFYLAAKRINATQPGKKHSTWQLAVSPVAVIWAPQRLARDAFARFHPLTVAAVVLDRAEYRTFSRRVLRDLVHPMLSAEPSCTAAAETLTWFHNELRRAVEALLACTDVAPEQLLAPPIRDQGAQSYCPRCEDQYVLKQGYCHHCGEIPLVGFTTEVATPDKTS